MASEAVSAAAPAAPAAVPAAEAGPVPAPATAPAAAPAAEPLIQAAEPAQAEAAAAPAAAPAASTPAVPVALAPEMAKTEEEGARLATEEKAPAKAKTKAAAKKGKKAEKAAGEPSELKPASASREDNLTYDLRHMAAYDIAPLPKKEEFMAYTRDSVQMLINHMFTLPKTILDEGTVAQLPMEAVFNLPRQKPIPKEKPQTRWQKFMEEKNMTKRKRSRLVFDEASGDWVPRWGYGSIKKKKQDSSGIYEVKAGEDPNSNPFERARAEQKLQQARQKMREVRNKVEAAGGKLRASVPDLLRRQGGSGRGADGLKEALKRAQTSTGSRGKFDRTAPGEATNLQAKRAKIHHCANGEQERERYMKFAGKVLSGETVDKDKAAKVGNQQAEGRKSGGQKFKGVKGTPGSKRRSKQGGRKANSGGGRTRGRKVKA